MQITPLYRYLFTFRYILRDEGANIHVERYRQIYEIIPTRLLLFLRRFPLSSFKDVERKVEIGVCEEIARLRNLNFYFQCQETFKNS